MDAQKNFLDGKIRTLKEKSLASRNIKRGGMAMKIRLFGVGEKRLVTKNVAGLGDGWCCCSA